MILRAGLPTDFCWDAYETSNYITNRLPTKTSLGYVLPEEATTILALDLAHLRIWRCKAYLTKPNSDLRKDFKDKLFVGYFIGNSKDNANGYKVYVPDLQESLVGVHVLFNEMIPTYTEE